MPYLIAVPVLALLSVIAAQLVGRSADARIALTEARDAQLVLALLEEEYYGVGETVYDPSEATGLAPGVMEEVAYMAELDGGQVYLLEWNGDTHRPGRMMYITDKYVCMYGMDGYEPARWTVIRNAPALLRQRVQQR